MSGAAHVPGSRTSPGMVVGTFNISEQGDGAFPDLNRVQNRMILNEHVNFWSYT